MRTLKILKDVRESIHIAAKTSGRRECLGLLAREPRSETVTRMTVLPAVTSPSAATAEPIDVKRAADGLAAGGLIPAGLWHSHASFAVFHSGTDDATIRRLMPAMATWNYESPPPKFNAPAVLDQDTAMLPLAEGQAWVFSLVGEPIPGTQDHTRAQWAEVTTRFGKLEIPFQARVDQDRLVLAGSDTTLILRLPPATTLSCRREQAVLYKTALLYSLVVNNRGEECVDCITVHNCAGRVMLDRQPSSLMAVAGLDEPPDNAATHNSKGDGSSLEHPNDTRAVNWAECCL